MKISQDEMEVRSFRQIEYSERTGLVALDIDETILYFEEFPPSYWPTQIQVYLEEGHSFEEANAKALEIFSDRIRQIHPSPTDPEGLLELFSRIQCPILFLTARPASDNSHTRRHLDHLGIPSEIPIHNSGGHLNGDKGKILRQIAEEMNVEEVIFVDDSDRHLNAVQKAFLDSKIECRILKFVRGL